jgi:predicted DsbA family dithiol-disulfide isomerase
MIGRSKDAHRLVHVASARQSQTDGRESVTDALVESIMRAFHEEERDITDRKLLRELATTAGMTKDHIEEAFQSEEIGRTVDEEADKYRAMIEGAGVPTYFINGGQRIDGSQDPADWFELFVKVKEGEEAPVYQGTSCS